MLATGIFRVQLVPPFSVTLTIIFAIYTVNIERYGTSSWTEHNYQKSKGKSYSSQRVSCSSNRDH